ncbi:bifunctional UDP-N-acetylglucosamine diphosphorylase/glucosamine-1-phosphate N-acetyltransferase GlmU [Corynebacterium sp. sy017]|uniref:bifunctional UDP-N-acetylglucosamine diphosphorylase/glucosamine-1-phosphate N-acetyltransferase GlmU n=1 Tax=unclassified Corynebacterium TaxID=2624378 RepID=UPI001185C76C|nr:bifunctional UDP-N-acetylglucosamine diphosphorylase/glucosamine-1-phosphate N-acetyltransferase GlmU [Corynebacterium sp. SY003]MBP3088889.1 bifunctional UDP-N-acetylglucosamine diphosphorylase/glucosamine-1-phosphate N-acetyltransferase GlmU [Corynebacterium sp. sy017]TSD91224.1 bifunctional UDP-N-acetylglucosamine diphosphorylase/glucosamine-1-phosphate N-acetyltransferase GlmU [Corynebacterium sp. SY003]
MLVSNSPCAVIVLAAGAGTRMKSKTQKTLHSIGGRSLLAHSLYAAAGIHPERIITVIGHRREQVAPAIDDISTELDIHIHTAIQEQQHGTGHAVQCAMELLADFHGTVMVTNADVPLLRSETLQDCLTHHTTTHSAVTVMSMHVEDPTGYGRIIRTDDGTVSAIVEQKDADEATRAIKEVNSGVFAFDADVLRENLQHLTTDNAQGELYLTDVLSIARQQHKTVSAFCAPDHKELAGVNDRLQLAHAAKELNRRTLAAVMRGGATIVDPESTWIDVTATIGSDVTIYPGTQILGNSVIGDEAEIGPDTTLHNMTVETGAQVIRTHGLDSHIGAHAQVGPFTYIRPGTTLGERGKLGGFVEAKNACIGAGSKVPHLTYIGDATVGEESNIGASSVFVNYDGVNKHHTVIGNHVRTGSDTMFIAPVTVGDGAYSGAGTVIRDDVPPGALAVSGGKQRNIENWVMRKRPDTPAARAAEDAQEKGIFTEVGDEKQ